MRIEHTRLAGYNGSPAGITWWTIEHNGNQYVVKQETSASGCRGWYQYLLDGPNRRSLEEKSVHVSIQDGKALVKAAKHDFVDIVMAVQLVKFLGEQKQ